MQMKQKTWKETAEIFLKDLSLFGSLCLARIIVWRALRRERKERAIRVAQLRLTH